ncbi:unnamed protein product [Amaranthus hypochondriacus]
MKRCPLLKVADAAISTPKPLFPVRLAKDAAGEKDTPIFAKNPCCRPVNYLAYKLLPRMQKQLTNCTKELPHRRSTLSEAERTTVVPAAHKRRDARIAIAFPIAFPIARERSSLTLVFTGEEGDRRSQWLTSTNTMLIAVQGEMKAYSQQKFE